MHAPRARTSYKKKFGDLKPHLVTPKKCKILTIWPTQFFADLEKKKIEPTKKEEKGWSELKGGARKKKKENLCCYYYCTRKSDRTNKVFVPAFFHTSRVSSRPTRLGSHSALLPSTQTFNLFFDNPTQKLST